MEKRNNGLWSRLVRFAEGEDPAEETASSQLPREDAPIDTDNAENRWLASVQDGEQAPAARFAHWFTARGVTVFNDMYRVAAVLICLTLIAVMLLVVAFLPPFGSPDNPTVNEVVERYVSRGMEETGTTNAVAGMISAYRGFDTLGEAHVLFVAACSVIVLLRVDRSSKRRGSHGGERPGQDIHFEPNSDVILRQTAKILVPLAFIFGLYVILNGTSSPGGGFSGGALIGAGLILNSVAFGFRRTEQFFNDEVYHVVKTACLTVYALLMAYFIFMGANGWDDHVWLGIPGNIISGGIILPINIAVGLEVACTLYCFYALFRKGGL